VGEDRPQLHQPELHCVDTEPILVGVELDASQSPRVAQRKPATVGESHGEPVPGGDLSVAPVDQRIARGLVVDQHPPGHAEVQPEDGAGIGIAASGCVTAATGVEQQLLASPPSRGERAPRERRPHSGTGETALQVPRVGRVDQRDLAFERAFLDQGACLLDLEDLGHGRSGQTLVIAPRSAPWARRAYLPRNPRV